MEIVGGLFYNTYIIHFGKSKFLSIYLHRRRKMEGGGGAKGMLAPSQIICVWVGGAGPPAPPPHLPTQIERNLDLPK